MEKARAAFNLCESDDVVGLQQLILLPSDKVMLHSLRDEAGSSLLHVCGTFGPISLPMTRCNGALLFQRLPALENVQIY